MFSCESFKVFKKIYFTEHLWAIASMTNFSEILVKKDFWMILQYFKKVVANLLSKSFGCCNHYQHIVL